MRPELVVRPDFAKAADLGVTSAAIAETLRINQFVETAGLRHLCGIVTQDRVVATLYFAGEFKAFVPVASTSLVAAASHHNHIHIAAQEGAFDLGALNGQRQRYPA